MLNTHAVSSGPRVWWLTSLAEERRTRHLNSGGDEALFGSGVPHHTAPALAVSAPLLSHTPTPVGSLVKGGEYGGCGGGGKGW